MSQDKELKDLARKAYISYHQDGIIDILLGIGILGFGLMLLTGSVVFNMLGLAAHHFLCADQKSHYRTALWLCAVYVGTEKKKLFVVGLSSRGGRFSLVLWALCVYYRRQHARMAGKYAAAL